jgi:hypothetical protein
LQVLVAALIAASASGKKSSPLFRTWIEVKCKHRTGVVLRVAALFLQAEKNVPLLLQVIDQIRPVVSIS